MKTVKIQSIEERLMEIDRVIINTCRECCNLMELGAPASEIDNATGFLGELFKRREVILWELKKAGASTDEAYAHMRARKEGNVELDSTMVL